MPNEVQSKQKLSRHAEGGDLRPMKRAMMSNADGVDNSLVQVPILYSAPKQASSEKLPKRKYVKAKQRDWVVVPKVHPILVFLES